MIFSNNSETIAGGNGGRGGDVILECSPAVWDFSGLQHHVVRGIFVSMNPKQYIDNGPNLQISVVVNLSCRMRIEEAMDPPRIRFEP